jgi:hypothetical protein
MNDVGNFIIELNELAYYHSSSLSLSMAAISEGSIWFYVTWSVLNFDIIKWCSLRAARHIRTVVEIRSI